MKQVGTCLSWIVLVSLFGNSCASHHDGFSGVALRSEYREPLYEKGVIREAFSRSLYLETDLENRILALDPNRLTEREVREVLAHAPAPRIIIIHGGGLPFFYHGVPSFAQFLIKMGYPENRIRNPRDQSISFSSYKSSSEFAGLIAWYYERERMPVMMIGYSSGGVQAVKVLHELAGTFSDRIAVCNPLTETPESRDVIVDPITGAERSVVGLRVGYAARWLRLGGSAFFCPTSGTW